MEHTASSAGSQDFCYSGPRLEYLDCPVPDFADRLLLSLNDDTAKARDVSCEEIATRLWGEPTSSTSKECRWGSRGSRSVNREKNVWFDHEANEGGNTIQLVQRELGLSHEGAVAWLLNPADASETCGPSRTSSHEYRPPPPLGRIVAAYDYVDEIGTLLSQVVRYEPKGFRQRRPDGQGGWSWSVKNVRSVPYRLPEVLKAIADQRIIVAVEGEKDVDALRERGFTATCNAGGAKKWRGELTPYFHGADVVLIPDNDRAGREHANVVGSALEKVAARVRVLDLPGLLEKGDVSDWLAAGHTVDELLSLIEGAPKWELRAPFRRPDTPPPRHQ
jgi:putative DNA primase/helicase